MVTLPIEFTAIKYPGYFWNTETETLWSLKVGGMLKELTLVKANWFNKLNCDGYYVSHRGQRRFVDLNYLNRLKYKDSEIPVKNKRGVK